MHPNPRPVQALFGASIGARSAASWRAWRLQNARIEVAATRLLAATYPAAVRAWINRHGGLTHRLTLLRGNQLAALYPHNS
jgi:hypothetical protein